jgi:hypothetical protein
LARKSFHAADANWLTRIFDIHSSSNCAGSSAIPNLFGDKDSEKDAMRSELEALKQEMHILAAKYQTLSDQHDKVTRMLIDRHIVHGAGFVADVAL